LPYSGGIPNDISIFYAPRASIYLAYYDMDPRSTESPPERKIEWRVEGTAPCRKMVISYYHIDYYNSGGCQGNGQLCTMQAVLYEGTGLIDIFYENKPACLSYQGGLSIAGVQNWNQDQAVTPPGKNCTVWTAVNEGLRYVPNGVTSLLKRVELYKNGTLISSDPAPIVLGNGELEATFPNICQAEDSMSYVVRAFYQQCDNPTVETEGSDTIIVYKTLNPLTTTATNALCNGGNGTITINSPTAANIEYSIDGGAAWQTSPVFNAPAGNYTVLARIIGSLCGGSTTATVTEPAVLLLSGTTSDANCANNTGSITLTAAGGTPAYEYSIDNGITYQSSNQFLNLAIGNYNNLKVKDANGCLQSLAQTVLLLDTMYLDLGTDSTICFGSTITLIPQTNALTDTFKWTPRATLNYDTVRTPVATPTDTTKYFVTAKWGICQRTDSVTVKVLHKPVAHAGNDTTICYKTNATLSGSASNLSGTVNYLWSPPDSLNTPNAASTVARIDTTRKFTLTVTDNYGCNFSVTDSMWVKMMPLLVVFAGNDTNAIFGRPHQLLASGGVNYVWTPAGPLNNPFIADPLAILYNDTYFHVVVTDAIGCTDDDDVFIKAYEGPMYYLPNAFSPNGDGLNDIFRPIPVGIQSTDYFRVFNRFGTLMYETRQWMQGWDGTLKGKPAAFGTYVWMIKGIDKNGSVVEMKGTVILMR
jgi:gliding motility-associated-like protein